MKSIRISIAIITTLLISFGIIMIYSSSGIYALSKLGDASYFLKRHVLFLGVGLIFMLGVMAMDYRYLRTMAKPLLLSVIVMLILVLIPSIGTANFGARRWFSLGPINFQPSELAKIAMLVYLADFLARKQNKIKSFREGFMPVIFILGIVCALIVQQPDLGNSLLVGGIVLIMLFIAGARIWHLALLGGMAVPLIYVLIVKVPYRLRRIIAFIDPWQDSQGVGFQLSQSQIALGSGGLWGVGLGKSVQKLFYLPAAHTDFILSIIGEELGLLGTLTIVLLFILFIWQGTRIIKRTKDLFGYYLGIGLVVMLGLQAVVNIGVSIGALPTKGLPLPFISYGGSALVFNMIAVGLLLNISRTEEL
ncbi:Cell division protein FtsW [hydrothermal vent metagenome]|uniref:peptidoglycan glycosyltransferase n=1 Tax=hydrothermal vent metagenome TaxID=652676 RepID=A0A3B1DB24_9ZZZZ